MRYRYYSLIFFMKITFLGQNGLLIESKNSKIIVDPYLSDAVAKIEPENTRRQRVDESFFSIKPTMVVITHAHADHYDEETLDKLLSGTSGCVLFAPPSVFEKAKKRYKNVNCVLFRSGTSYTAEGIKFRAVKAEHSDTEAVGVIISCEDKDLYVTGDTLYSERVFESLPENLSCYAVFLPINGRGNNMNAVDAARFLKRLKYRFAVPMHFGLFDDLTGRELICENAVIPEIFKEIMLK